MIETDSIPSAPKGNAGKPWDAAIAVLMAALCSFLVYHNLGNPPLTGIDDENITQVYGLNLANGFGFVYTPHFEHVEGATSSLWVGVHYLLYKITTHAEPFILLCSAAFSALAIYWALGISRVLLSVLALPRWALWIPVVAIATQPYYFHWTVVTMMDQSLWAALVLGLSHVLVRHMSAVQTPPRISLLGVVLCCLSVLARPEAMLLLPLMLGLAAVIFAVHRGVLAAIRYIAPYCLAVVLTLAGLTAARIAYFGYPLPNTYYAKVSSNPSDNIHLGAHYFIGFLSSNLLVLPGVLAAVLAVLIGGKSLLASARTRTPLAVAPGLMLLIGGTLLGAMSTTILEGGDHFPGFRMLQPYVPLMAAALLFYGPFFGPLLGNGRVTIGRPGALLWSACIVIGMLVANYSAFTVTNKSLKEDFTLAVEGRRIGDLLNTLSDQPAPDVGVLPAGGVAVTYHGRVVDLLGLNWSEMAHASGRRTGPVGHSAFNLEVFWRHPPAIMLPDIAGPARPVNEKQTPANFELYVLQGLLNEPRFRETYSPVLLHLGDGELFAYAREDFIEKHREDARIEPMAWERFRQPSPRSTPSVATN